MPESIVSEDDLSVHTYIHTPKSGKERDGERDKEREGVSYRETKREQDWEMWIENKTVKETKSEREREKDRKRETETEEKRARRERERERERNTETE